MGALPSGGFALGECLVLVKATVQSSIRERRILVALCRKLNAPLWDLAAVHCAIGERQLIFQEKSTEGQTHS
jgi:hypothetical protein